MMKEIDQDKTKLIMKERVTDMERSKNK